jgi:class 3 adenylate cyclase
MILITHPLADSATIAAMESRKATVGWVALPAALLCCLLPLLPGFAALEAVTEDLRFVLRGPRKTTAKIVLAPISEESFKRLKPTPMALWGGHLAQALAGAYRAKAAAVGVDYIPGADADEYLRQVIQEVFQGTGQGSAEFHQFDARLGASPTLKPNAALQEFLLEHPGFVVLSTNGTLLEDLQLVEGTSVAWVGISPQRDGAIRTMEQRIGEALYFPSALAVLRGERLDSRPTYGINYVSLRPKVTFPVVPFERLHAPNAEERAKLDGACVLIGASYAGANDDHVGLLGQTFLGLELNGQALATLLDRSALHRGTLLSELGWAAGLALLGLALLGRHLRFSWGLLALAVLLGGYLALAQWYFVARHFWLPLAAPALALVLPFAALHLAHALSERKSRLLVERVFGQYLSPTVRDYLLASPENRALGGQEADATVLFFDLRGSTTYAEGRSPGAVLTELNRLFGQVVPVLQRHEGTVLRYSGDGFLAIFGAPTPDPDHAVHALAAVAEITERLTHWNAACAAKGEFVWHFGMGLHSGPLIWGSLGSAERPELTLIGDTVNLAARLQDATKTLEATVVFSEETWRQAHCPAALGPRELEIRGRREPLSVYFLK